MRSHFYKALIIIILCMCVPAAIQSRAQDLPWNHYKKLSDDLLTKKQGDDYDFTVLRGFYTQSAYYDPVGQQTIATLDELVKVYGQAKTVKKKTALRVAFDNIMRQHFGNIGVVNHALTIVQTNPIFGNEAFLKWVSDGLTKSLLKSGDGSSLARSYNILTLGEEAALTQALNLTITNRQTQKSGVVYYGIYDGIDRIKRQKRTLFVDLTIPMLHMEKQMREEKNRSPLSLSR